MRNIVGGRGVTSTSEDRDGTRSDFIALAIRSVSTASESLVSMLPTRCALGHLSALMSQVGNGNCPHHVCTDALPS